MKAVRVFGAGLTQATLIAALAANAIAVEAVSPTEARAIAKDAYIYGYPLVDSYRILHAYCVNKDNPEYKGPWNHLQSMGRVFTPEDKAIQTPNSDTPYSMLGFDLRTEPLVLSIPPIEQGRYFSIQFVDAYTHNFAYVGSRTTGNDGGSYLLAGPSWKGEVPAGVKQVLRCETELGLAIYRTQLFHPEDIGNVRKIQASYKVQTLSAFLNIKAPDAAPAISFVEPMTPETIRSSNAFFENLSFVLQFCPVHPSEKDLRERFAKIGVGAGGHFRADQLTPALRQAFADGIADGLKELAEINSQVSAGKVTSGDLFGTREHLRNNYLFRFAGAVLGIYANSTAEAIYPAFRLDANGHALDGAKQKYIMRFAPDQFPPVNAFWSATLYELPKSLLYANTLNRYLINSPMLPKLKRDTDGGLTIYVQHESPGIEKESNWLPAPKGPFWIALRLYWPKDEAVKGNWNQPKLETAK